MELQKEAQRIMSLSVWKLYHSRLQRGGLRLHRSLQLSLVMRSARELYLAARPEPDPAGEEGAALPVPVPVPVPVSAPAAAEEEPEPEPMETQEGGAERAAGSRKRRSSSRAGDGEEAPSKRARLEAAESDFPGLPRAPQSRFFGPEPTPGCRPGDGGVLSVLVRAVVAF